MIFTQLIFILAVLSLIEIYLFLRKQKISFIGLTWVNFQKSATTGIAYSGLYLAVFFIIHLIKNDFLIQRDISEILVNLLYFLIFVSLFEETSSGGLSVPGWKEY